MDVDVSSLVYIQFISTCANKLNDRLVKFKIALFAVSTVQ